MKNAIYDKEGNVVYRGRGRKPEDLDDRIEKGECYHLINEELVKVVRQTKEELEGIIASYLRTKQENARDNCTTCKSFTIPVDAWPKKRLGFCNRHEKEVKATDICKQFARPGELTDQEAWDNEDADTKKKILKKHREIRKRLDKAIKILVKDFPDIEKKNQKEWERFLSLDGSKIGVVEMMAKSLEKRYQLRKAGKLPTFKTK